MAAVIASRVVPVSLSRNATSICTASAFVRLPPGKRRWHDAGPCFGTHLMRCQQLRQCGAT